MGLQSIFAVLWCGDIVSSLATNDNKVPQKFLAIGGFLEIISRNQFIHARDGIFSFLVSKSASYRNIFYVPKYSDIRRINPFVVAHSVHWLVQFLFVGPSLSTRLHFLRLNSITIQYSTPDIPYPRIRPSPGTGDEWPRCSKVLWRYIGC